MERQAWQASRNSLGKFQRYFQTPEELWEKACEYFNWCDSNPFYKTEQMKKPTPPTIVPDKEGKETIIPGENLIEIPVRRPYTKGSLCTFMGCYEKYLSQFRLDHKEEEHWITVLDAIDQVIFSQQYEGAASGFFNSAIVARHLGIAEKVEAKVESKSEVKQVFKFGDEEFEW